MAHQLATTIALLGHTPATLDALLRDLPEAWTRSNEGGDTWNAFDVVAHLIYCERIDWMPRVRIVLASGEARTFDPFDRLGHVAESASKSLPDVLDEFAGLRAENLHALLALKLTDDDLRRTGSHPSLGRVTLSQLLSAWAVHDLTHLHQISRTMAHQYREAVGPWSAYLGVLRCGGHSAP